MEKESQEIEKEDWWKGKEWHWNVRGMFYYVQFLILVVNLNLNLIFSDEKTFRTKLKKYQKGSKIY